jgi:tetratricopeptide (TPR) repeat protein
MRSNPLLRTFFAALIVVAAAVVASAQSTQVNGKVTMKQADGTVVPVVGAVIDIYRTDIKADFHTKTDKKGNYIHAGLPFVGTYTVIVSAPGAAPASIVKQRFTQDTQRDFELRPGDGSRPTIEQVAAGAAGGAAPAAGGGTPRGESKEEKAAREAREKEIAEIEKKNTEITQSNELVNRVFKAGNDALFATPPRLDEAITNYREGVAARPEEVALLTNLAEALRQRADSRYNTAVKEATPEAKVQGMDAAKKDWAEGAELASKAVTLVKAANPAGANVNAASFEQNKKAAISVRALLLRRVASKVDQSKAADAIAANQEYLEMETDPAKKARIKAETLQALFDGGSVDLAMTEAQKILAEEPDNPDANRILGLALFATGDKAKYQEAANYLQRYVDKAPDTDGLKQSAKEALDYLKTAENVKPEKAPARPTRRRP